MSTLVKKKQSLKRVVKRQSLKELVLYNDDVNTFEHVITTLIKVCHHTPIQAEQSAMLVHYKGKCTVKTDELMVVKPMCLDLLDAGLSAKIQ